MLHTTTFSDLFKLYGDSHIIYQYITTSNHALSNVSAYFNHLCLSQNNETFLKLFSPSSLSTSLPPDFSSGSILLNPLSFTLTSPSPFILCQFFSFNSTVYFFALNHELDAICCVLEDNWKVLTVDTSAIKTQFSSHLSHFQPVTAYVAGVGLSKSVVNIDLLLVIKSKFGGKVLSFSGSLLPTESINFDGSIDRELTIDCLLDTSSVDFHCVNSQKISNISSNVIGLLEVLESQSRFLFLLTTNSVLELSSLQNSIYVRNSLILKDQKITLLTFNDVCFTRTFYNPLTCHVFSNTIPTPKALSHHNSSKPSSFFTLLPFSDLVFLTILLRLKSIC
ncbi:hypothetical protein GEMRC1_004091 [Eukaryota sp. GEM-RC1]